MGFLLDGVAGALGLIGRLDSEILSAASTTLRVSLASSLIAGALALPLAVLLVFRRFPGREAVIVLLRTALALPTVVVALFVYALIARRGPLGSLGLLFTPAAIVIGQVLLVLPLMTALLHSALRDTSSDVYEEALALGASRTQAILRCLREASYGVLTAWLAGFGRVVAEIGVSLILGGNIKGATRTMTTAISLATAEGDFPRAVALGLLLLGIVLAVNAGLHAAGSLRNLRGRAEHI